MKKINLIKGNPNYKIAQEIGLHFLTLHTGVNEGAKVDMSKSAVEIHACGTTMCHGGWYQWLTLTSRMTPRSYTGNYTDGANKIAKDLGFADRYQLEGWADFNPKIWGNFYGGEMFSETEAFGVAFDRNKYRTFISLELIGKHWLKVAAKLEDIQTKDAE